MKKQMILDINVELGNYDNISINSPFRYPGGKFYARGIISPYIPHHNYYVEPMVGGGSIFFYKNKVESWINDLDEELINCYETIKNNVEEMINYLDGEEATKERHSYYKNDFKPKNNFERSIRYYYLNRTSYSGIMKWVNCYFGYGDKYSMRPENWGRQLRKNHSKLQNVNLTCLTYKDVLKNLPTDKDTFVFLDPPYFNADQDKFYNETFNRKDHEELEKFLFEHQNNFNFLMTYDNSEEIREMYSWTNEIVDKEWNYTINRTDNQKNGQKLKDGFSSKRYKGKEIFIFNFKL